MSRLASPAVNVLGPSELGGAFGTFGPDRPAGSVRRWVMRSNTKPSRSLARVVVLALLAAGLGVTVATVPAAADDPPSFIRAWGSQGTGDGQFQSAWAVAVAGNGDVYVLDGARVQKFTANGTYLTQWGSEGSGNGQFSFPGGIAVDRNDNSVYVADTWNDRIQKFSANGTYLAQWGTEGDGEGQFTLPSGIAVDGDGNVYVEDANSRIQKFTSAGAFVTQWDTLSAGGAGSPEGVAVDASGNVYVVANSGNVPFPGNVQRVEKYTSTGSFLTQWGNFGSGPGQFIFPHSVAVDGDGHVYVADTENDRVQEFSSTGTFLSQWGGTGTSPGQFDYPLGIATDGADRVYVADSDNNRIQAFGPVAKPDGRIRKGATGAYSGDGVYNTTGVGQTKSGSAARGATVTYWVSAQNDAPFTDVLRLKGTASNTRFRVTYTAAGVDITAAVVAGTYTTPVLGPGDSFLVKVVVKVKATAPAGSSLTGSMIIKSDSDPARRDTVKFVTGRS